jgi:cell division protein FtsN
MTRTDVMASSRPRTVGAAPSSRKSTSFARRLSALPVVLLLVLALVLTSTAMAAEEKSGYSQTTPTTSTKPTTTPKTGTAPAKEAEEPAATTPTTEAAPEKATSTAPTTEKATALPFTGFDLSWDVGFGLLLIAAGFSILAIQRRQRRHPQR